MLGATFVSRDLSGAGVHPDERARVQDGIARDHGVDVSVGVDRNAADGPQSEVRRHDMRRARLAVLFDRRPRAISPISVLAT